MVKKHIAIAWLFVLVMVAAPDIRADCNEINYVIWKLIANGSVEELTNNLEVGKSNGCTPWSAFYDELALVHAAKEGNYDVARLLIEYGIAINAEDRSYNTALDYAVESRDAILVELLLDGGATVQWQTMQIALENGFIETVRRLSGHFGEMDQTLVLFLRGEEERRKFYQRDDELLKTIRILIQNGADVNRISKTFTPLTALTWSFTVDHATRLEAARLLIDSGADVNKKDGRGDNALLIAAASRGTHYDYLRKELINDADGNYELAKLLLDRGASTLVLNGDQHAPPIVLALFRLNSRIVFLLAWKAVLALTLILLGICVYMTAKDVDSSVRGSSQFMVVAVQSLWFFAKVVSLVVPVGAVLVLIVLGLWLAGRI